MPTLLQILTLLTLLATLVTSERDLATLAASQEDIPTCNYHGLCVGTLLETSTTASYSSCLKQCRNKGNCTWVTFVRDSNKCSQFYNCLATRLAPGSYSSQVGCTSLPVCNIGGECHGHVIGSNLTETVYDCLENCKSLPECEWYTFLADNSYCVLMDNCSSIDDTCTGGLVGERECLADVTTEVVDLSGRGVSCATFADFFASHGSVGTFIRNQSGDDQVLVCAGDESSCYNYDAGSDTWVHSYAMSQARRLATAVQLSPTKWWVTGGVESVGEDDFSLSSTEILTVGVGFSAYVDLLEARQLHNLIKMNDTHVFLLGDLFSTDKAWMFDLVDELWTALPDLLTPVQATSAGLVTFPDGRLEVVVAAGISSSATQIYSLDTGTWRYGPIFPGGALYGGSSVQYGSTFLVAGGLVGGVPQDSIYIYDIKMENWKLLPQGLVRAKYSSTSFLISDDFINCLE